MTTFKLRDYQSKVLGQVQAAYSYGKKDAVLAACPSSGKTNIACEFIRLNPGKKILVLTHGTNVIKSQWPPVFTEHGVDASTDFTTDVTYGLPHNFYRVEDTRVDILIVDEAHEFTFAAKTAGMVAAIQKNFKPKFTLYLTGTPSKFIQRGFKNIIIVPAIDLIEGGYVSDLYVGMISTTADLQDKHYNKEDDLAISGVKRLESKVETDLDAALDAMYRRLREANVIKKAPTVRQALGWVPLLGKLRKTMFACASIKQAEKVTAYFQNKGIKAVCSHSENDLDSERIDDFVSDESILVLVVVDRGILGFNFPELVNVVDLTCSKNIDRIYQLYARVMRKHPKYSNKFFFKLAPEGQMLLARFYMNAALMLMFEAFISKYNGRNLNESEVLVERPQRKRGSYEKDDKGERLSTFQPIDKAFHDVVTAGALLKSCMHKLGQVASEYAYVTFGDIKKEIGETSELTIQDYIDAAAKMEENWLKRIGGKPGKDAGHYKWLGVKV